MEISLGSTPQLIPQPWRTSRGDKTCLPSGFIDLNDVDLSFLCRFPLQPDCTEAITFVQSCTSPDVVVYQMCCWICYSGGQGDTTHSNCSLLATTMLLELAWTCGDRVIVSSRTPVVCSLGLMSVQDTEKWLDCCCFRSSRIVGHNQRRGARQKGFHGTISSLVGAGWKSDDCETELSTRIGLKARLFVRLEDPGAGPLGNPLLWKMARVAQWFRATMNLSKSSFRGEEASLEDDESSSEKYLRTLHPGSDQGHLLEGNAQMILKD